MFKKIALSAALAALSLSAFGAEAVSYYGGADIGLSKFDSVSGSKTSIGGFIGAQLTEHLAVEGGYRRLGEFTEHVGTLAVTVAAKQAALSLVGSVPVGMGLTAYGRIGYNRLTADASVASVSAGKSSSSALYGAGVSYAISPVMSVRVEATKLASDTSNVSLGVAFKF
jgi:opacity protein-like surface antigen